MKALWYLRKTIWKNQIKKALKRPTTYLFLVLGIFYIGIIVAGIGTVAATFQFDSAYGLVILMTIWSFYMIPANFVSYAGRKGIIFRPCQAHFVFTAPISPKRILLDTAALNLGLSIVGGIVMSVIGVWVFHLPIWRAALMFLLCFVLEMVLECSLIIIVYGSDRFADGKFKRWGIFIKGILIVSAIFFLWYFKENGISLKSAAELIEHPVFRLLPVVGWDISAFRLVILGPDRLNVIGTVLYLGLIILLTLMAIRMKNTGAYYEDAAKFADDYQELRNRSKRGETGYSLGKKKKFRTVKGNFGGGAKAIFYRQLLEYKKERFFIFDSMTLICVVLAGVLAKMMEPPKEGMQGLVMMGLIAYMSFCASGYAGKWDKELENPYLYLIPDTAVRKMWNATKMEHIKAFFDGLLMAGMIGYFWHVPFWQIAVSIVIYVLLQANKMYLKVFAKMLLGNTMGNTGRTILRLLIQSAVLGVGVLISVAAAIFLNPEVVFAVMLVYSLAATVIVALFASMKFEVLEQNE